MDVMVNPDLLYAIITVYVFVQSPLDVIPLDHLSSGRMVADSGCPMPDPLLYDGEIAK